MDELKPCPFCGMKASVIYDSGNEVWNQSWRAGCTKCGIQFKESGSNSWASKKAEDDSAKAKAIAAWNTRTPSPGAAGGGGNGQA